MSDLRSAGLSDTGRLRRENEDRIHADLERGVFLVVDGLGGHAAGERAAETAIEVITARLQRQTGSTEERIREAIALANHEIYRLSHEHEEWKGMACVVTLAVMEGEEVCVGHVGDSRLYVLEPGRIRKITHDHSPVGEREDAGELSERDAMAHPRRNEVYRDLGSEQHGPDDDDFIEFLRFRFTANMAMLMCSDGLSDQVPSEQIRSIVEAHAAAPRQAVAALIDAANEAGGKDNVSVILVEGPDYARRPPVVGRASAPSRNRALGMLVPFLAGLVAATLAVFLARPHWLETATGTQFGFGPVRAPITWKVGPGALPTIAEAISKAHPGDTVQVEPGIYRESLRLPSGVNLVSRRSRAATIEGAGVVITADNVADGRLAGFKITGPAQTGLRIINSDLDVNDVEVSGMTEVAVEIGGTSRGSLRASRITGNFGPGILVHGVARPVIAHNAIVNNGRVTGRVRPGIQVSGSAAPSIADNLISNNGAEQVWVSPLYNAPNLLGANVIAPGARNPAREIRVVTK